MLKRALSQFLLDEEGSQMRQLPSAGHAQHDELNERPAHDLGVGGFTLVSKLGFSFL
jgi:hypothetical protein